MRRKRLKSHNKQSKEVWGNKTQPASQHPGSEPLVRVESEPAPGCHTGYPSPHPPLAVQGSSSSSLDRPTENPTPTLGFGNQLLTAAHTSQILSDYSALLRLIWPSVCNFPTCPGPWWTPTNFTSRSSKALPAIPPPPPRIWDHSLFCPYHTPGKLSPHKSNTLLLLACAHLPHLDYETMWKVGRSYLSHFSP